MDFSEYFPIWDKLTPQQQERLSQGAVLRRAKKGAILHNGTMDCLRLHLFGQWAGGDNLPAV